MTEPSIAARAEAMQDRLVSYSAQRGSNPKNIPATMHQVLELAGMVRDLASSERPSVASILLEHAGPYFDGGDMRCKCRLVVENDAAWAEHVAQALEDGAQ